VRQDHQIQDTCPQLALHVIDEAMITELLEERTMIYIEDANFAHIKFFLTLRIKGIEKILKATGPLAYFLNLFGTFTNISDAEFEFDLL
jgi:hypothetical protein